MSLAVMCAERRRLEILCLSLVVLFFHYCVKVGITVYSISSVCAVTYPVNYTSYNTLNIVSLRVWRVQEVTLLFHLNYFSFDRLRNNLINLICFADCQYKVYLI